MNREPITFPPIDKAGPVSTAGFAALPDGSEAALTDAQKASFAAAILARFQHGNASLIELERAAQYLQDALNSLSLCKPDAYFEPMLELIEAYG